MSLRGIIASMTIEEATDGGIFLAYVEHILCPALKPGDVVVMDNLNSHKIKGVQRLIEKAGAFYTRIHALVRPTDVMVDFGCGRGEYVDDVVEYRRNARKFQGKVSKVIGIDIDEAGRENRLIDEFRLLTAGSPWPVDDSSVDVVYADWVVEHLPDPDVFFREAQRALRPGGILCLRTPNLFGYVAMASSLIPNAMHGWMCKRVQSGRREEDVFPTVYRCNTRWALRRQLRTHGFDGVVYGHECQPCYLHFSSIAYALGTLYQKLAPSIFRNTIFVFASKR
jgi:SAM-dependent methyltransferase